MLGLTYGENAAGTYRFRVAADYPGIGIVRSEEFSFVRIAERSFARSVGWTR